MRTLAAAVVVGALVGAPAIAVTASSDRYTPDNPPLTSLSGSAVYGQCRSGEAWIDYRVLVTDPPDGELTDAVLALGTDSRIVTVDLGSVGSEGISGRVPWPRDAVADPAVTATLTLQPALAEPLTFTVPAPDCAPPSGLAALAATGAAAWLPAAGLGAIGLVAAGVGLRLARRRRES
jgi:hypothetical protein